MSLYGHNNQGSPARFASSLSAPIILPFVKLEDCGFDTNAFNYEGTHGDRLADICPNQSNLNVPITNVMMMIGASQAHPEISR
jgi:hypothetical protein